METLQKIINQNNANKAKANVLETISFFLENRTDKITGKRLFDAINKELMEKYGIYGKGYHGNSYGFVTVYYKDWIVGNKLELYFDVRLLDCEAVPFSTKVEKTYSNGDKYTDQIDCATTTVGSIAFEKNDIQSMRETIADSLTGRREDIYTEKKLTEAHAKATAINAQIEELEAQIEELPYKYSLRK